MRSNFVLLFFILGVSLYTTAAAETGCKAFSENVDHQTCCPFPDYYTEDIFTKCQEFDILPTSMINDKGNKDNNSTRRPIRDPLPPHAHPCFDSCMFNKTGILNSEQKLDEKMLHDYLEKTFQNEDKVWIPVFELSFKKCAAINEKTYADVMNKQIDSSDFISRLPCSLKPKILITCVVIVSFYNCPNRLWNGNGNCNAYRDFLTNCLEKDLGGNFTGP